MCRDEQFSANVQWFVHSSLLQVDTMTFCENYVIYLVTSPLHVLEIQILKGKMLEIVKRIV